MRMNVARADATTLLIRALRLSAAARGIAVEPLSASARPWASATFEGTRHRIRLALIGGEASRWLAILPDVELPMRHHIVADLAVDAVEDRGDRLLAILTVLTLAEH